jgi:hypothetical protein
MRTEFARWIYAEVIGVGPLCFQTDDPIDGELLHCRQLTNINIDFGRGRVGIEKCKGYGAGILADPVVIPVRSCSLLCHASKNMSEKAEEAWSPIAMPNAKETRDLGGKG